MQGIQIGDYFDRPEVDYQQPALFTWREFYSFRNHVLRVLRVFGSAGPMGEVDLSVADDDQPSFSSEIVKSPDFFVVDDMYNEHDRISIVECDPVHVGAVVIESLCAMMRTFPGWWVSFSFGDSGLLVSSDTVLIGGRRFWDCTSVAELSERCGRPVDFGAPEPLVDSMNDFWRVLIAGGVERAMPLPAAPSRQWAEVIRAVGIMRSRHQRPNLNASAYNQVRHDLHPQTIRELLLRLFKDLPALPDEMITNAKRNIQQDSARALLDSDSPESASELIGAIWSTLEETSCKFGQMEIVSWWADVLCDVKPFPDWLKDALQKEMRSKIEHPNQSIQLCALFGLAKLHAPDISPLVDRAIEIRPAWRRNEMLMDWLGKLKQGKTSYPDRLMLKPSTVVQ